MKKVVTMQRILQKAYQISIFERFLHRTITWFKKINKIYFHGQDTLIFL